MKISTRIVVAGATLLTAVTVDQITKIIARKELYLTQGHSYLGDTFRFQYAENSGAFLGMGANLPPMLRYAVFNLSVAFFLALFLFYVLSRKNWNSLQITAGCMVIGGGLSNLIDRFYRGGYVIDFMNMGIGSLRTGIFNVADMLILAGVGWMLIMDGFSNSNKSNSSVTDMNIKTQEMPNPETAKLEPINSELKNSELEKN